MRSAAVLDRVEAAASGQDTDDLLVLWQRPSTREIVPIGRFSRTANGYSFVYTRAAAEKRDFRPLLGLPDLHQRYDSQQIPAVFSQRVMSPSRPDYGEYLAMLGLSDQEQVTPWEQIVHSGGSRVGDTLQFMRVPVVRDGRAVACFLANGVRHIPDGPLRLPGREVRVTREQQEAALEKLRAGDLVLLEPEQGNPEDDHAILVTSGGVPLGWVPRVLSSSLRALVEGGTCHATVRRIGRSDTPYHLRLVLDLDVQVSDDFAFDPEGRWVPLVG